MLRILSSIVIGTLIMVAPLQASLIRITQPGVAVDESPTTHPVIITGEGFRLTHWGGGDKTIMDPLVLIFATPEGTTPIAPTLTASGASNPDTMSATITLGGTNVYGGTWDGDGYAGTFNETSDPAKVYDFIGFDPGGSDSQNYTNWNGYSGRTSWDLWVYTVTFDPDFARGYWFEFATTNLGVGSFVIGYGCTGLNSDGTACGNSGTTDDTPFTFAGYVPEPKSVFLIGAALIGLFAFSRRRTSV